LPNGVDLSFWKPSPNLPKNKVFTFLAVGRLENQKGYEYLIKAASLLSKRLSEPFLIVIVGEGSQKNILHKLAVKLNLQNIVIFAGNKTPQETQALLARTDVVICPSLYETTPLTLLEAWSAKTPVIITPVGILRDTPTDFDAALIVPPKDEFSLMRAMARCIKDADFMKTIANKGYKQAKKYAWPAITQTAEVMYKGAL
jgi:glycosyltransferase involved in cell wall biosynthesis